MATVDLGPHFLSLGRVPSSLCLTPDTIAYEREVGEGEVKCGQKQRIGLVDCDIQLLCFFSQCTYLVTGSTVTIILDK